VLVRAGHTEAGCDLAQLAGCTPAAVICEILKEDGTMARLPDLVDFAGQFGLKIGAIADLIHYRSRNEKLIERRLSKPVHTPYGEFTLHAFADRSSDEVHLALTRGEISAARETLVRVHEPLSALDFLDPAGSRHTFPLDVALAAISRADAGVIVLLHRPESGADMLAALANDGAKTPTTRWDPRTYGIGAQILRELGVGKMKLLGSPRRMPSVAGFDLEVTGHIATQAELALPQR
jgi:3,4-dihydroxy 2-butanone 4-phosphate synthase/GTP cyclohydrolase II